MALFFLHTSAVFIECVLSFHPHLVLLIWPVCVSLKKSSARVCVGAQECVCVCACVFATVCVASALCERWCENASRAACVSSASNMRKICGTYLQCDTSQNDMTQPCYTRAMQPQPAGTFLKHWAFQKKKKKKQGLSQVMCSCIIKPKERGSASTCVGARNSESAEFSRRQLSYTPNLPAPLPCSLS